MPPYVETKNIPLIRDERIFSDRIDPDGHPNPCDRETAKSSL